MGGGGGILGSISSFLFGSPKEPDPVIIPAPQIVQATPAAEAVPEAETAGETAAIKETARRRKAKGALATIATGYKGDTSMATTEKKGLGGGLTQTLGGGVA